MKKFCIVIPLYNEEPEITELFSLRRLNNVIKSKSYDVFLMMAKDFKVSQKYLDSLENIKNLKNIVFDNTYFESTDTYSQLLINYDFYNKFCDYEYMLIYQTDCYLFKDDIKTWCNKGYDYIGAPIIAQNKDWSLAVKGIPQVGNGGLSLRKVSTFLDLTNPKGEFITYYNITKEQLEKVKYEDVWFCDYVWNKYEFNIPTWKEASKFALDMNVKVFFEKIKIDYLPMGCHAWPKNIRDWKDKFKDINQNILDYCEEKYKELFKVYYE